MNPFSGHFFSFSNTCGNSNLSIRKEGKELAKQKPDFREERPKKFNEQQINLAMNLLKNHSYKEVEKMTRISKSTLTRNKRKEIGEYWNIRCFSEIKSKWTFRLKCASESYFKEKWKDGFIIYYRYQISLILNDSLNYTETTQTLDLFQSTIT